MVSNNDHTPSSFKLGISLSKPHLLLPDKLSWWTEIHSNYIRTQNYECWHIIEHGDYVISNAIELKNYTTLEFGRLEKNHKAKQLILNGLTRQDVDKIMPILTEKEVWEAIQVLQTRSKDDQDTLKFDLQREFHSFSMKSNETVGAYHSRFQILCDKMKAVGVDMTKINFDLPFIHGLGSRFTKIKGRTLVLKEISKTA